MTFKVFVIGWIVGVICGAIGCFYIKLCLDVAGSLDDDDEEWTDV